MVLDKSPALKRSQKDVVDMATKIANRNARAELLSSNDQFALGRRLATVLARPLATLRHSWEPFKADYDAESGFGLKLRVETDLLVRDLMQDTGTLTRAREIGIEAMVEAMADSAETEGFVTTLLNDLVSEGSFYAGLTDD